MQKIEQQCKQCGKTFSSYVSQKRQFCGYACKVVAQRVPRTKLEPCGFCGELFKPYAHESGRTQYCSRRCGARGRYTALGTFGDNAPSRKREQRIEYLQQYRAKKRKAFVAPVDPKLIYERDGGRCGVCKKKMRFDEVSLDHIVPISRGGTHEPGNVQIAHMVCNSRKSNTGIGQMWLM